MDELKKRYSNKIAKARIWEKEIASAIIAINSLKNFENETSINNWELLAYTFIESVKNYTDSVIKLKNTQKIFNN